MEKKMENEMETVGIWGFKESPHRAAPGVGLIVPVK